MYESQRIIAQLDDENLQQFATPRQWEVRSAVLQQGTFRSAGKMLGTSGFNVKRSLKTMLSAAAERGYSPKFDQSHPVPEGQRIKGVSTCYKDGKIVQQWVKTAADKKSQQLVEFANELSDSVNRALPVMRATEQDNANSDLLAVYPIGDPHFGMLAWGEESGEDFDIDIAERHMRAAVFTLMSNSRQAKTALILNLGDFFHADNLEGRTRISGNNLDTDTRWPKVMRLGARLMRDVVEQALYNHDKVVVKNLIGNHDDQSSVALSLILDAFYSQNDRVEVDISPSMFFYFRHGKTLIGATHGHTAKTGDLTGIMASDVPRSWGETTNRYWLTGHIHQRRVEEVSGGVTVESFRTLAARDAWNSAQGYRPGRDMYSIIYSKAGGEIMRTRVGIESLRGTESA